HLGAGRHADSSARAHRGNLRTAGYDDPISDRRSACAIDDGRAHDRKRRRLSGDFCEPDDSGRGARDRARAKMLQHAGKYNSRSMPIRVLHFGLGPIGTAIVKQVASRPGFKPVGGVDIDPAKTGRDLGDVAGLTQRLGVKVWSDAGKALKSLKPDVVVLCTSSSIKNVMPQI